MVRFLFPALSSYPQSVSTTIRSKWVPAVFVFPILLYLGFLAYERELTDFIIPFFPDEPDKSFGFYNDFLRLCFRELLWYDLFLFIAWALYIYSPLKRIFDAAGVIMERRAWLVPVVISVLCLAAALVIARYTLETFANSADEYVYLYQAETLSQGKLMRTAHPLEEFFHFNHIAQKDGISVGRFPPGWPLLLAIPYILNFSPYWMNPLLATLALVVFYTFARRYYGKQVALWSLLSLGLSGFYIFNAASYFSHTSCLLFSVGFVYCLHLANEKPLSGYAVLAGAFLGLILITRYFTAVLFFVPVVISLFYQHRWNALRFLFLMGIGFLPFFIFLFWYNYSITGDGFLPVTVWADPEEALGFVKGHTWSRAIEFSIRRLLLFLYWCSPAVLILYFIYLIQKALDKTRRLVFVEDYFFVLLLGGYFFYHHLGGNQYGPRFLFEALPFAIVFVVNRIFRSKRKLPLALFAAGLVYGIVKFPYLMQREKQVVEERTDLYAKVQEAGITNAVVLVSTHTGVIRPMPPRDLTRNDVSYDGEVIYAEDLGQDNAALMEYYPTRRFYRYERDREKVEGWLEEVRR